MDNYILFEHQLTMADLKGSSRSIICSFGLLLCCFLLIIFIPKIPFSNEIFFVNINILAVLSFIFVVVSAVFVWLGTNAKIILTEDGIYYKPPVSRRIYEMKYGKISTFYYKNSMLFVCEKNNGKHLSLFLEQNIAEKIIIILRQKVNKDKK